MYSRWFSQPDPAYGQLVNRLYGADTGAVLYRTYCEQLSRRSLCPEGTGPAAGAPTWSRRLDWQGIALYQANEVVAHAVVQMIKDKPLVYIGYVESVDSQEVAVGLVQAIRERISSEQPGRTIYLPVNLSIWHSYRFKTWGAESLPFEPPCQPYYGKLFGDLLAQKELYSSYRMPLPTPTSIAPGIASRSLRIRQLCLMDFVNDLRALYQLSGTIFDSEHSNPSFEEFAAIYGGTAGGPSVDPRLVLIAEWDGQPVGFIFAVARGQAAYIKTFAVCADYRRGGVARQLYDALCLEARQMGCDTLYGLMIRDDRPIRRLLPASAVRVAGYTLFKDQSS